MRVMCISHNERWSNEPWTDEDPQIGEECNVTQQRVRLVEGITMKQIKVAEGRKDCWYDARCFATLPEATATEMYEVEIEGILF